MDQNFNDQGFVSECDDYISCKERWYFKSILESLIVPKTMYNLEGILEKNQPIRMYAVGRKYLANCCGIRGEKAVAILTTVENRLRAGRAVVVSIPVSPVKGDSPMVFVPEVGRFMPIYEE